MSVTRPDHLIWERLLIPDPTAISADAARYLRDLDFPPADHARMDVLGAKAGAGTLTPDERAELDEFVRVGHQLARIQILARHALKNLAPVTVSHE